MAIAKCTRARDLSSWGGEMRAVATLRQPAWLLWEKPCSFLLLHLSSLPAFFFSDFPPIDRCDPTLGAGRRKELSTQNSPRFNSEILLSLFSAWVQVLVLVASPYSNTQHSHKWERFSYCQAIFRWYNINLLFYQHIPTLLVLNTAQPGKRGCAYVPGIFGCCRSSLETKSTI